LHPNSTRNFDSLVSKQFYDSTAFNRVIPGFNDTGGDPNSKHGDRPPGEKVSQTKPTVNAEFSVAQHVRGIFSAARIPVSIALIHNFFIV